MELRSGKNRHLTETIRSGSVIKCTGMDSNWMSAPKFKRIKDLLHAGEKYKRMVRPNHNLMEEFEEAEKGSWGLPMKAEEAEEGDDDDLTHMNMTLKEFWQSCKSKKKRKHTTVVDFSKDSGHPPSLGKQEPYDEDVFDIKLTPTSLVEMPPKRRKKSTCFKVPRMQQCASSDLVTEMTPKSSEYPSQVKESSTSLAHEAMHHFNSVPPGHSDGIDHSLIPIICVKNEEYQFCDDIFCEYEKQEYYRSPFTVHNAVDNGSQDTFGDSREEGPLTFSIHSSPLFPDSEDEVNRADNRVLHKENDLIHPFSSAYPFIHETWNKRNNEFNGNLHVCLKEEDSMDGDMHEIGSDKSFGHRSFEPHTGRHTGHDDINTDTLACTETFISGAEIDPLGVPEAADDHENEIFSSHTSEFQRNGVLPTGVECLGRTSFSPECSSSSCDFILHEGSGAFEEPATPRDDNELTIFPCSAKDNWYPIHHCSEAFVSSEASSPKENESLSEVMNNGLAEINENPCNVSQGNKNSVGTSGNTLPKIESVLDADASLRPQQNGGGATCEPVPTKKKVEKRRYRIGALKNPHSVRALSPLSSTSCTTIKGCSQHAVAFSQRQMHDIDLLANKLTKELKHMKSILKDRVQADEQKAASPSSESLVRTAIRNATRVEETSQKWLSIMSRNCDRFCKIMRMSEMGTNSLPNGAQKVRKITFADEVGGVLCHVRFFEDDTAIEPDTGGPTDSPPRTTSTE